MTNPDPPPDRPSLLATRMLTTLGATRFATALIVLEYESSNPSSEWSVGVLESGSDAGGRDELESPAAPSPALRVSSAKAGNKKGRGF
jgi:hypothetical protein